MERPTAISISRIHDVEVSTAERSIVDRKYEVRLVFKSVDWRVVCALLSMNGCGVYIANESIPTTDVTPPQPET